MGEHGDGLKQMLQEFAGIRVKQQASAGQLKNLQQMLKLKEKELAFAHFNLAELQQEGVEAMKLIGNIGDLVGEIPEYKKRISELSESVDQSQRATQEKLEEISRVEQKQERENAMVEERIEGERLKERAREQTNIEELEKLLRGAQEIEVENGQRQLEKEKQKVQEQTRMLEEENRLMRENHSRKIQTMNNQLLESNKASDQTKVISMEVIRKDMELMKQEYERQLSNLARQIAAFKERKAGQQAAAKKKKVSFDLPGDVSSSATENQDEKKKATSFTRESKSRIHESVCHTSSKLPNADWEELGHEDGPASWKLGRDTTAVAPHTPSKCVSSSAGSTPAASCGETSALSEEHSEAGASTHHPSFFKFVAPPAVKSREMLAGVEYSRTTTLNHSPLKFVARSAGSSVPGLSTDFCTFATRQHMVCAIYLKSADAQMKVTLLLCHSCYVLTISQAGDTEIAEGGNEVVRESLEDFKTGVGLQESTVDEIRLQEEPSGEIRLQEDSEGELRLQENQRCSYNQFVSGSGFKRRIVDGVGVNSRSMADEGTDERSAVMFSKKERTRNTDGEHAGARKPMKRKLYSETGNGPKILE